MIKKIRIVAVVLVVFGFFFFYLAGRIDYDYSTTYFDKVNVADAGSGIYPYDFGNLIHFPFNPLILMETNDYITISYDTSTNGTVYIVLWHYDTHPTIIKYSDYDFLDYKTQEQTLVQIYLASQNPNNIIPTTVILHHYERPNWLFFSAGVIVIVLATVLLSVPLHLPKVLF